MKKKLETIHYNGKYQPKEIISDMILRKENTHLIKDRTGSGATYGVLNLNDQRILFVCPTVHLVKDKEKQYKAGHFKDSNIQFYYGDSVDDIVDCVPETTGGHIVMATIDQFVKLRRDNFTDYTLIIDELHLDVMSSLFRPVLDKPFKDLVAFYKDCSSVITITATPLHKYPPIFNDFNIQHLTSDNVIGGDFSVIHSKDELKALLTKLQEKDENIIFFSNDRKMLIEIANLFNDRPMRTIFGSSLDIKHIVEVGKKNDFDAEIILASSAAMEGLDINLAEANIIIHNRYKTDYGLFTIQGMIQGFGRSRDGFKTACIYMDESVNGAVIGVGDDNPGEIAICGQENKDYNKLLVKNRDRLADEFRAHNYKLLYNNEYIDILNLCSFDSKDATLVQMVRHLLELEDGDFLFKMKQVFNNIYLNQRFYGYKPRVALGFLTTAIIKSIDCDIDEVLTYIDKPTIAKSTVGFRTLLEGNSLLSNKFSVNNGLDRGYLPFISLKKKNQNNLGSELTISVIPKLDIKPILLKFEQLSYLLFPTVATNNKIDIYSDKQNLKYNEDGDFIPQKYFVNAYLNGEIKRVEKQIRKIQDEIKKSTDREVKLTKRKEQLELQDTINNYKEALDLIERATGDEHRVNMDLLIRCLIGNDDYSILKNPNEIEKIKVYVKKEGRKKMKDDIKTLGCLFVREFKTGLIYKKGREYSVVTSLPMEIYKIVIPSKFVEYDISEAYPSFLNAIIGRIGVPSTVYETIMEREGISRKEAKKKYNTMLNSTLSQISLIKKNNFFINSCGYTPAEAAEIIKLNVYKGEAYNLFAMMEKEVIEQLQHSMYWLLNNIIVRRHDSLIVFNAVDDRTEVDLVVSFSDRKHDDIKINVKIKINNYNGNEEDEENDQPV